MSVVKAPTPEMRQGRRFIESLPAVTLLQDLTWFDDARVWGMLCRLTIGPVSHDIVPPVTDWWVTVEDTYPFGKITFRPAVENGLAITFPHQQYNGRIATGMPWRSGDICVRSPSFVFGKDALDPDPFGQPYRLAWYFHRALDWLETAAANRLLADGDPFELPDFPGVTSPRLTVVHGETLETFQAWKSAKDWYGTVELVSIDPPRDKTVVLRRFLNRQRDEVLAYPWGRDLTKSKRLVIPAAWLRCEYLPVILPYQAIDSWNGLLDHLRAEEREGLFRNVIELIRDGEVHFLLLGFPIPSHIGQASRQLHWQPILLPKLSHGNKFRKGFRANAQGYWMQDRYEHFSRGKRPDWHKAANWSKETTAGKGRMDCLSDIHTLVIGAGAVGSVVSELLVRSGCGPVVICDGDDVEHGNLCRHTLQVKDVGRNKAEALADRLSGVHAHSEVRYIPDAFPPAEEEDLASMTSCKLVLDCTGDDATLYEFSRRKWESDKIFCSISLSYKAARVYVYTAHGRSFPLDDFLTRFAAWAKRDAQDFAGEELVLGGAGCWHPSFPARVDDVWMLSAAAVRRLEEAVFAAETEPKLTVFEQVLEEGFRGLRRV